MKIIISIIFLLFSFGAFAKAESWYFQFGMGIPFSQKYPGEIQKGVDNFKTNTSASSASVIGSESSLDFGFYFPMKSKSSIWGITYTFSGFSEEEENSSNEKYVIGAGLFGISFQTFTGSEPGSGLFFRFDLGRGAVLTKFTETGVTTKKTYTGFGGLGGIGVGLAVTEETRILLGVNYNYTNTNVGSMTWFNGYFAFLW